jgi:hypothetical protein
LSGHCAQIASTRADNRSAWADSRPARLPFTEADSPAIKLSAHVNSHAGTGYRALPDRIATSGQT